MGSFFKFGAISIGFILSFSIFLCVKLMNLLHLQIPMFFFSVENLLKGFITPSLLSLFLRSDGPATQLSAFCLVEGNHQK